MFLFVACSDDDDSTGDVVDPDQYVLSGVYTSDISLDANHIWTIRGRVYVASGATMTIPAGTILKAEGGTGTNASFLCVAQGGKLIANGTASAPIMAKSPNRHNKIFMKVEPLEPEIAEMCRTGELSEMKDKKEMIKIFIFKVFFIINYIVSK